jgi:hypothetical protein
MRLPATARWIGLALLGLAIAAAVSIAAGHLVSQQIGIASESITAGDRLAPAVRSASAGSGSGKPRHTATTPAKAPTTQPPTETTTTTTPTTPTPPSSPQPPVATTPTQPGGSGDEHGGQGGHRGGGGGGADD